MENGFSDIVILEAENRIGGRIHSIDYGSGKIDLGGQWVEGEKNNVIYEMTKGHFDFGVSPYDEVDPTYIQSNGQQLDQEKCLRLSELAYKIIEESKEEMKEFNGSIGEFFNEHYSKALNTSRYADIDMKLTKMILENKHTEQNGYYASTTWFEVSAKYAMASSGPFRTWKDKGYISAVDFITVSELVQFYVTEK